MSQFAKGQRSNWRRITVGLIAVICVLIGGTNYLADPAQSSGTTGMLIRVGIVFGAVWLAMPQLETLKSQLSIAALLIALLLLVVAAARPNFFRVAAGIVALGLALNWCLTWLSKVKGKPNRH